VSSSSFTDSVSVLRGLGGGAFDAPLALATNVMPVAAAAADFNRDRGVDLVTANALSGDVSLLLNEHPGRLPCTGDCDEQGTVSVNELVRSVSIALGQFGVAECIAADPDANATIAISELVAAVRNALEGCE
jgi:hypothetical protein